MPGSIYRPGSIFWFDVPAEGLRQAESRNSGDPPDRPRPWVVVAAQARVDGLVTAVPLTTRSLALKPWRVPVAPTDIRTDPPPDPALIDRWGTSLAQLEQVRALDVSRIVGGADARLAARLVEGKRIQICQTLAEMFSPTR